MAHSHGDFVPALGADWLTPLYDLFARLVGERRFKRHLIEVAKIAPGHAVLDLGCGTGTLALLVKAACPQARVVGLDIDPRILAIARRKVQRAAAAIEIEQGSATEPPFAPASFDRVLSTLMLHHLTTDQKRQTMRAGRCCNGRRISRRRLGSTAQPADAGRVARLSARRRRRDDRGQPARRVADAAPRCRLHRRRRERALDDAVRHARVRARPRGALVARCAFLPVDTRLGPGPIGASADRDDARGAVR